MSISSRKLGIVATVAAAVMLLGIYSLTRQRRSPVVNVRDQNPPVISLRPIESITLNCRGAELGTQPLIVKLGETVEIKPELQLRAAEVPTGSFVSRLFLAFHPEGTPEDVWSEVDLKNCVFCGLLGQKNRMQVNGTMRLPVLAPRFAPGRYEIRFFLVITDFEGNRHVNAYVKQLSLIVEE